MKEKEIIKRLKTESNKNVPDPIEKIKADLARENYGFSDETEYEIKSQQNGSGIIGKKRKLLGLFSAFFSMLLCLALILYFTLSSGASTVLVNKITLEKTNAYGLGAVSTVKLLGTSMPKSAIKRFTSLRAAASENTESGEDGVIAQAEKFNEYFSALDSFLGEDIVTSYVENNPDTDYPYELKMTVKGKEFDGSDATYIMYYTETLLTDSVGDVDDDEDDEQEEQDEIESSYTLEGVMVVDGKDYFLKGSREEESEKDEYENELEIRAYLNKEDVNNYIQMKQERSVEKDENETEYVYSVVVDGKTVEQTSVEFETERKNNKEENEFELEFISGSAKGRYSVKRETKGDSVKMKVKYSIDGKSGVFIITETQDANGQKLYKYSFSDGSVKII